MENFNHKYRSLEWIAFKVFVFTMLTYGALLFSIVNVSH
jgi:hypothetical protein